MAMALVSTVTLGTAASSIQFTGIPATGKDLLVLVSTRLSDGSLNVNLALNGSTSNFSSRGLVGSGSSASSDSDTNPIIGFTSVNTDTSNTFGNLSLYIANYAVSQNKSMSVDSVTENNATAAWQMLRAVRWANTAAITSVSVQTASGNFVANSTASLYIIS
jgi:hypothetical protein